MRKLINRNWRALAVGTIVTVVSIAAVAGAANLITGKDIKNGSVTGKDVKGNSLKNKNLGKGLQKRIAKHAATGATGLQGPTGQQGPTGAAGVDATYVGPHWGTIDRNVIGEATADLRAGPFAPGAHADFSPPSGVGSLNIEVGDANQKVEFGNELDFNGNPVSGLSQASFWVFQTGEDRGINPANLPNIDVEINPRVASKTFTTMVFVPPASTQGNDWEKYDGATAVGTGSSGWYFTNGTVATATGCSQTGTMCSLSDAEAALVAQNDGSGAATILTVGVGKGRDDAFQGAVDDLQINNQVFNFEPFGVSTEAP
jgi:hypothetical protein